MAKIVINNATGISSINSNFDKVESEFNNKVLYRDNPVGEPNEMLNNLDMNGNRILNLPLPGSPSEPLRLQDVTDINGGFGQFIQTKDEGSNVTVVTKSIDFTGDGVTATAAGNDVTVNVPIGPNVLAASSGASLVGFTQNAIGAVLRTAQAEFRDCIRIGQFGVVGDGVADDTVAFQAALTATRSNGAPTNGGRTLFVTKGTYKITTGLVLGSDQTVYFEPGVVINLVPSINIDTTSVFLASNQTNVFMYGNGATLNGARALINPILEGNAAGFFFYGVDNFRIQDFNINNMATDGITLGGDNTGSGPCTDGVIDGNVIRSARRNGISPISFLRVTLVGNTISTTNGAPAGPWAGIDVEPNLDCFAEGLTLIGNSTISNAGAGIQITPGALAGVGAASRRFSVTILGGDSVNDGSDGGISGLYFANGGTLTNKIFGSISVKDFIVDSPLSRGVTWRNWDADKCPVVVLDNVGVLNPDSDSDAGNNYDRSGFVLYADATQATTTLGNIIMRDCWAEDTQGSPWMVWGFVIDAAVGKTVKNVRIDNPVATNFVATSKMDVATRAASVANGMLGVTVNYNYPSTMTVSGSGSVGDYSGKRINVTASSNLTLPAANACIGSTYDIQCNVGVNSVSVVPASGDIIRWYGDVTNLAMILDNGGFVKLRSRGSGEWQAEQVTGQIRIGGTSQIKKTIYTTAVPATGTWTIGDRAINAAPAVGQPKAWACTVTGSPGTWVSEGNL